MHDGAMGHLASQVALCFINFMFILTKHRTVKKVPFAPLFLSIYTLST